MLIKRFSLILLLAVFSATVIGCAGSPKDKSTGEYVDDAVITTKVKAALINSPDTDALDIDVDTFKGRVQLNGFVDSNAQAMAAEKIAKEVNGVVEVDNQLAIK